MDESLSPLHEIQRTLGQLTEGVKALHEKLDDRDKQAERRHDRLDRELEEVRRENSGLKEAVANCTRQNEEAKTAHLTYEQTVGTAVSTRAAALLALGTPPSNPGQLL